MTILARAACLTALALVVNVPARAQQQARRADRAVYVDSAGVIRWKDNDRELALFGANYTLPSASDYRAAGYLTSDRKKLIDDDMAHFARMGWDGLRISFWGDWENSDHAGNLIVNDHLDLVDYLIAKASERGIYTLLSPITTYESTWPDAQGDTTPPGFAHFYKKSELGTNPAAIAAQVNYLQQLLRHVNPYTGVALKDDPSIIFVEMINEPTHHSKDVAGSVAYINALADAVRSTGSKAILFHNLSQDFAMAEPIAKSSVQGITFGWYPTGLNSGHELRGNYLRTADAYEPMRDPRVAKLPRIVYEFDSPDLRTGYMYPAMARTMRAVGAQFASMFAYDMLATASRNLGWQTHYLNLVYTPRKAMSAVIAAEVMRRIPRNQPFGSYPSDTTFGDFHVSYESNSSVLMSVDTYLNAGTTNLRPRIARQLTRVAGYGSSPIVSYGGEGVYFLDLVRQGIWRLEVYPDAVPVRDPFELQSADKIVTRAISRSWPMHIMLPDLGGSFSVERIAGQAVGQNVRQVYGEFDVTPGVYILSRNGPVSRETLPRFVGALRLDEYHAPPSDTVPLTVTVDGKPQYVAHSRIQLSALVADTVAPDSVVLSIRRRDQRWFRRYAMRPTGGYEYQAYLSADSIGVGPFDYAVTVITRGTATSFPGGERKRPWEWNYVGRELWHSAVVPRAAPMRLFTARDDVTRLAFSRIGDGWREGVYRVLTSTANGEPVFHLELPRFNGRGPDDYTASLALAHRLSERGDPVRHPTAVRIRLRAETAGDIVHLTLVERDGSSWSAPVRADTAWRERAIPLAAFKAARSAMLPEGFPGEWNYWVSAPPDRQTAADTIRWANLERVQFSLRPAGTRVPRVEIEWVSLDFH